MLHRLNGFHKTCLVAGLMASCDNVGYNKLYTFMNTFESCAYAAFCESCFFSIFNS